MAAPKQIVVHFDHERSTSNAERFSEDTSRERGVVGTLYVLKSDLEKAGIDPDKGVTATIKQRASR
jgi:hypothetical protein